MTPYLCETERGVPSSADDDSSDTDSSDGEDRRLLQLLEQKVASATENVDRVLRAL